MTRPVALLAITGATIRIARADRPGVEEVRLATPGGAPLPVESVTTPAAIELLRRTLRPALSGIRLAGFTLHPIESASQVLYVPRPAEKRLETLLSVVVGLGAVGQPLDEIARFITCDSLGYLSRGGMMHAVRDAGRDDTTEGDPGRGYCDACFTGNYPVALEGPPPAAYERLPAADDRTHLPMVADST